MSRPTKEQLQRIRKLVETLRTTKKRQGRGYLAQSGNHRVKYCCLGIACEVALADGVVLEKTPMGNIVDYRDPEGSGSATSLPEVVYKYFGFDDFDPDLIDEDGSTQCATDLNDDKKYNFKRIADAFERTFLNTTNQ